jgi:hypothetical protein
MATGHGDNEHLHVAYGILLLHWRHAPRPKGNWVVVAFAGGYLDMRRAIGAITGVVRLLRDNDSYSKTNGIRLKTDRPSRIKMCQHRGLSKALQSSAIDPSMASVGRKGPKNWLFILPFRLFDIGLARRKGLLMKCL